MRRLIAALACVGVALISAGCSSVPPRGTDGDLTNNWPSMGAPKPFKPKAGTCHESLTATSPLQTYQPVSCRELHVSETIYVGTLTGQVAETDRIPDATSPAATTAYQRCSTKATSFVSRPWRTGLISLTVVWPSRAAWTSGARWYRCDLTQADLTSSRQISREGSLHASLVGAHSLLLGCFNPTVVGQRVDAMTQVACTQAHRAEFAGVWKAPDMDFADLAADRGRTAQGCRSVIAAYTDVPDDDNVQYRSGWISYNPTRTEWSQGERGVRCFMWFTDAQLTRSLKGIGPAGLPIQYN